MYNSLFSFLILYYTCIHTSKYTIRKPYTKNDISVFVLVVLVKEPVKLNKIVGLLLCETHLRCRSFLSLFAKIVSLVIENNFCLTCNALYLYLAESTPQVNLTSSNNFSQIDNTVL